MGFGSYDESEQQNHEIQTDDDEEGEGVSIHEHDHDGDVEFEPGASADGLIKKLEEIKTTAEEEETEE